MKIYLNKEFKRKNVISFTTKFDNLKTILLFFIYLVKIGLLMN